MEIYNHHKIYNQNFFVYGHRGVPFLEEENTLRSFERAIDLGFDGVELDIMSTKDGKIIVNHDTFLKINDRQERPVSSINYEKIKNFPALKDILISIGHMTKINIEIKDQGKTSFTVVKELITILKELSLIDNILISSFNPSIIKEAKKIDDRFSTAWIWEEENLKFYNLYSIVLKYYNPDAIHVHHRIVGKELVQKIHQRGMKVIVYTVNDKEKLERMISMDIDGVFTDNPKILEEVNQKVHQNIL